MFFWLLAILLAAMAAPWLVRLVGSHGGWLLAIVPTGIFAALLNQWMPVGSGQFSSASLVWVPELNLAMSLRLDGLSLLFGLLITGIGAVILIYTGAYLKNDDRPSFRFTSGCRTPWPLRRPSVPICIPPR